ncbi:hypothetical protein ACFXQA_05730 [Microbacterium sp. P07]|uniref:hypothetical protein n=1 Tax=Microbacterium sp. P07 TaxID=3366952 RepID=UPI0037451A64
MTNPPYPPSPAGPQRPGNTAGLISVVLVAASLAIQLVTSLVSAAIIGGADVRYDLFGAFTGFMAILQGLVGAAAVVVGGIGLAARERPKALAGIGLGGGAVVLFGLLASQLTTVLVFAFSG